MSGCTLLRSVYNATPAHFNLWALSIAQDRRDAQRMALLTLLRLHCEPSAHAAIRNQLTEAWADV